MSGVEKITERIVNDAREKAASTISAAEAKCADIIEKSKKRADKNVQSMVDGAKAEGRELIKRKEAVFSLELRKEVLSIKRQMLDKAFALALEKLQAISDEEYDQLMAELLAECAEIGDGEVLIAERDKRLLHASFISKAEKMLADKGLERKMKQGGVDKRLPDGFVYVSGGMEINCSLASIVSQKRESIEAGVYRLLFGE